MRLFVVLRSVFFLVLLAASLAFVAHERLCINYIPHQLDEFVMNCKEAFYSITQIDGGKDTDDGMNEELNRTARSTDDLQNITSSDDYWEHQKALVDAIIEREMKMKLDAQKISENTTEDSTQTVLQNKTNSADLIENITRIEKWYSTNFDDEIITINAKTCFSFSINEIIRNSTPQFSIIVSPLRLTLILIVTSFLVAVLDLSLRIIMHQLSLIQCLIHTFIQVALWGSILFNMEMYRRAWTSNWTESGQPIQEIPMYPSEWSSFEMYAFVMMLLSIFDSIVFEHLSKNIKLVRSQGVYKCIEKDSS